MILGLARIVNYDHKLHYKLKRNLRSEINDGKLLKYRPQIAAKITLKKVFEICHQSPIFGWGL
jgi:hypothetical protein